MSDNSADATPSANDVAMEKFLRRDEADTPMFERIGAYWDSMIEYMLDRKETGVYLSLTCMRQALYHLAGLLVEDGRASRVLALAQSGYGERGMAAALLQYAVLIYDRSEDAWDTNNAMEQLLLIFLNPRTRGASGDILARDLRHEILEQGQQPYDSQLALAPSDAVAYRAYAVVTEALLDAVTRWAEVQRVNPDQRHRDLVSAWWQETRQLAADATVPIPREPEVLSGSQARNALISLTVWARDAANRIEVLCNTKDALPPIPDPKDTRLSHQELAMFCRDVESQMSPVGFEAKAFSSLPETRKMVEQWEAGDVSKDFGPMINRLASHAAICLTGTLPERPHAPYMRERAINYLRALAAACEAESSREEKPKLTDESPSVITEAKATAPVNVSIEPLPSVTKANPTGTHPRVEPPQSEKPLDTPATPPCPLEELKVVAAKVDLSANEIHIIEAICSGSNASALTALALKFEWQNAPDNWNAARNRLNNKFRSKGWKFWTKNGKAIAKPNKKTGRK